MRRRVTAVLADEHVTHSVRVNAASRGTTPRARNHGMVRDLLRGLLVDQVRSDRRRPVICNVECPGLRQEYRLRFPAVLLPERDHGSGLPANGLTVRVPTARDPAGGPVPVAKK
jgi:hypothetical protein